ncbi:hypothetical protein GF325_06760, partial [Candidatus Bathyarchaeota archaeon]|nr:hypothetical protein [Candidatus Bathyarchaeota archaeon]
MATIRSFGFGRHSNEKKIHGMDASTMHQGSIKFSRKPSQELGVVVPSATGDSRYLIDVLRHEGLYHDVYNVELFRSLKSYPTLIIILGPVKLDPPIVNRLRTHAFSGGGVMTIGFVEALEGLLGTMIRYPLFPFPIGGQLKNMVGEGYLVPRVTGEGITKAIDANWMPLHGFGCVPSMADGCTIHAWYESEHECKDELTAITVNHLGRGIALGFHVDLVGTLRHMQEGIYVDKDGIPPPDGMSPVDDGILKAEDGLVLDWTKDRRVVSETHQVPAFTIPVADAWRRLFRSSIEFMADECNVRIQRMDYWPNGAPFIALLSHDTDGNDEKLAKILLDGIN